MADDVLRMRATIATDEALANLRKMRGGLEEFGRGSGRVAAQSNTAWATLGGTVKNVGRELSQAIPALGGFGLGAAGVGLAAGAAIRTLTDMSKRVTELKYASVELRMGTTEIRGWALAAEKVGISSETMMQSLKNFSQVTDGLKYNIGGVRSQMYALGAGPIIRSIMATTDKAEQLRKTFQFKDTLLTEPNGMFKAQEFLRIMGLNTDLWRLSADQAVAAQARIKQRTEEAEEAAKAYQEQLAEVSETWGDLVVKAGNALLPGLTKDLQNLDWMIGKMSELKGLYDDYVKAPPPSKDTKFLFPENPFFNLGIDPNAAVPNFLGFGNQPRLQPTPPPTPIEPPPFAPTQPPTVPRPVPGGKGRFPWETEGGAGFRPMSFTPDESTRGIELTPEQFKNLGQQPAVRPGLQRASLGDNAPMTEFTRAVKTGVFDALVDFASYRQGGGPGGGVMPVSLAGDIQTGGAGGLGRDRPGRPGGFGGDTAPGGVGGTGAGPGGLPGGPRPSPGGGPVAPPSGHGSVTPGAPGSTGPAGPGGSGGITAPAGTPVARQGLATVTTPSGKTFRVDARYAENFKGFLADYEKAGGVLGPDSGTLGTRPRNASGHPIGTAIDINQIGYGIRSRKGTSLDPAVEDALAKKWGFVSGHQWRKPDTGHFGIQSPKAAAEALIRQGKAPAAVPNGQAPPTPVAPGAPAGTPSYEGGTKATWFDTGGKIKGWPDPSGQREGAQKSGLPSTTPGIATPGPGGLGEWYQVTLPDGRTVVTQKVDQGPGKGPQAKGVGLDVNAALASTLYPGGPGTFPSGKGGFKVTHIGKNLPPGMIPGVQPARTQPLPAPPQGAQVQPLPAPPQGAQVQPQQQAAIAEGFSDIGHGAGGGDEGTTWRRGGRNPRWARRETPGVGGGDEDAGLTGGAAALARAEEERRIDNAISPMPVNGSVNVTVNSNGTKASTDVKNKGRLFQKSTIRQHRQMQRTEDAGSGGEGVGAD